MKIFKLLAIVMAVIAGVVLAEGRVQHNFGAMMAHANPMPNLMQVVVKHGDQIDLSEEQASALAEWRNAHQKPMHDQVVHIHELEQALFDAAVAGKPKAELMVMTSRIMNERTDLISTKADCRDNMMRILSPEQFKKVVSLYQN